MGVRYVGQAENGRAGGELEIVHVGTHRPVEISHQRDQLAERRLAFSAAKKGNGIELFLFFQQLQCNGKGAFPDLACALLFHKYRHHQRFEGDELYVHRQGHRSTGLGFKLGTDACLILHAFRCPG